MPPLLAAEAAAAEREELNLLYVVFTRARQVFIASGSQSTRAETTPYVRLAAALKRLRYDGYRLTRALLPDALPIRTLKLLSMRLPPRRLALGPGGHSVRPGRRRAPCRPLTPLPASASCCTPFRASSASGGATRPMGCLEGHASWWQAMG